VKPTDPSSDTLEDAIAAVYRGHLEEFVQRRDALAKALRSAGKRDAASAVKSLRKPSRIAWALDVGALEGEGAIEALALAADEMQDAQVAGTDLRAAIARLRAAVRQYAARAAQASERLGHSLEAAALVNGLWAVLGRTESFEQLRRGHLADIPEAGGLDLLTSLPVAPEKEARTAPEAREEPPRTPSPPPRVDRDAEAREAARQTAAALAVARERAAVAREVLHNAESRLHAAEARLRLAEEEARAARDDRDRAREEADAAAAHVLVAEAAAADAEQRIEVLQRGPRV
jgi:hypothetical protein